MTQPGAMVVARAGAIEPQSMAELRQLAKSASDARFAQEMTPDRALILMMTGRDLGMSYTQSLRAFHLINGKPAMLADAMVGLCLASGKCDFFDTLESTSLICTVQTQRTGRQPQTMSFTIEDAKKAGLLTRDMWLKYPAQMLRARAKSALARDVYPDLLLGMYDPDELAGDPPQAAPKRVEIEVTQAPPAPPSQPVEVEPSKTEVEQLIETLATGLRACRTPEDVNKYWSAEVFPVRREIKKKGWDHLCEVAKARKDDIAEAIRLESQAEAAPPSDTNGDLT